MDGVTGPMRVPYPAPMEHPDYSTPDPCETCDAELCICDQLTDEARDEEWA